MAIPLDTKIHTSAAFLETNCISKTFTTIGFNITLFSDISIVFEQGRSYAITGASGSGKSTFLHMLACLDVPTTGTVLFNKKNYSSFTEQEKASFLSQSIGLVFQVPYLLNDLSVIENIMMPSLIIGNTQSDSYERAYNLLEQVGLAPKSTCSPGELSGGERQRVVIARAMINKPAFLIADEPISHLDIKTGKVIVELLCLMQKRYGMGLIVSSHDQYVTNTMEYAYEFVDKSLIKQ